MALLMLFALLAGAGTALSPCVLPILPAVLGVGVTGGRRRPLGVVTGLAISFTFATVALVYVIDALGLPDDIARTLAIVVLAGFGISLLVPAIGDRIEAFASRIAPGPARFRGDGFGSGLVVGASLGLVYAPCAGPILAGVITVSAAQDFTAGRLAVALSYAVGSALVLYALLLGGRRFADRLAPVRGQVQVVMGALMICVAVLMATDADLRFQNAIADDLPAVLVNPTGGLEEDESVASDLQAVSAHGGGAREAGAGELDRGLDLPRLGLAPDFTSTQSWFNTEDGEALRMEELRGKVVLIDFWTYTCINCIRTFPHLRAWDSEYRDDGLVIVGVHAPEFPFERDAGNVADAIAEHDLRYPVVQDNDFGTWTAYGNRYWPAKYLIDADGQVRYVHFGEGEYETTERAIRTLLREKGDEGLGAGAAGRVEAETANPAVRTPEAYLGAARAEGWVPDPIVPGSRSFSPAPHQLDESEFAYGGDWQITPEGALSAARATIEAEFVAEKVFLVMGSPGAPRRVRVLLDGRPVRAAAAGEDVRGGAVRVGAERLYRLIDLPEAGRHRLELRFQPGVEGYAFTFG